MSYTSTQPIVEECVQQQIGTGMGSAPADGVVTAVEQAAPSLLSGTSRSADNDIGWVKRQEAYWNSIAPNYDSRYSDAWSKHENALVQRRLSRLLEGRSSVNVLEFGCGTGLGYDLITSRQPDVKYVGVDVSTAMLDIFAARISNQVELINEPLESLASDRFSGFDLVMAIFTSASYVDLSLSELLQRMLGWLRRDSGAMYISFLNRTSLSHLRKWGLKGRIEYDSRGFQAGSVPAWRYRRGELMRVCRQLGLAGTVHSLGPFAGLVEHPALARINSTLADITMFTHTIDLVARKRR